MASASSETSHSISAPLWKYDVFLSFRGEDTRKGFTDHLQTALKQKGILAFIDDEELERGEYISKNLLKAIQESKYAVVIISENYAFSKWCLIELTEIIRCQKEKQVTILPVFYYVDPSDIRNQKGIFANSLARHREALEEEKKMWSNALTEVGHIAGWHVHNRHESTIVKEICGKIFGGLSHCQSNIFEDVVGIESQMEEVMTLLHLRANDVLFIGIYGMGGIGKTTLANVIFEKIAFEFEASCFVDDVREQEKKLGMVGLQKQVIAKILNNSDFKIWNFSGAIKVIANGLRNKKVFIVLDNINKENELKALAGSHKWFGQGSRILLTSRDKHLLKRHADKIYEVNGLSDNDALQLFSLKAFKEYYPKSNYVNFSKSIVDYARGLPLALEVFGSLLFGKGIIVWENVLERLKAELDSDILDKLIISFEDLSDLQKELFLDLACFFKGEEANKVIFRLRSLGHYPEFDIEVLEDKSLIKILKGKFHMHDLLQEMGQQIVRRMSLRNPGKCSRLWCYKDIICVLKNNIGTEAIEGIVLKLPLPKPMKLSFEGFSKMKRLRLLVIRPNIFDGYETSDDKTSKDLNTIEWQGDPSKFMLSNDLCILEWWGYPLEYFPKNFEPNNLAELKMPMSSIKQLWDANKNFDKLKYIDLSDSPNFIEMPDFNQVPNLQELDVKRTAVRQLSSHLVLAREVSVLRIGGSFPRPITFSPPNLSSCLKSLKELELSYCNLTDSTLPSNLGCLSLLQHLNLSGNKLTRIDVISQLSNLETLWLVACSRLKALPSKLPFSLQEICLKNCQSSNPFHIPVDTGTSFEKLVRSGESFFTSYFGFGGKRDRTLCWAEPYPESKLCFHIAASVSWGPTLTSDIPEWFNQRSASRSDVSEKFLYQMDFNMNDYHCIHCIGGYALFIVYEVSELNIDQREKERQGQKDDEYENPSSKIFPAFAFELQVDEGNRKVHIDIHVPEVPSTGRNGVWVFLHDNCFESIRCRRGYIGLYSITFSGLNVKVKQCRGRFVLEHDPLECYENIRSISAHDLDSETLEKAFFVQDFWVYGPKLAEEKL